MKAEDYKPLFDLTMKELQEEFCGYWNIEESIMADFETLLARTMDEVFARGLEEGYDKGYDKGFDAADGRPVKIK